MPILSAANKVPAVVGVVGQLKEGEFGQYHPVLFERQDKTQGSEDAKVWKSMKPADAAQLSKGQQVYLIPTQRQGRDTWDIELVGGPAPAPAQSPSAGLDDEKKKAIAQHVKDMARLYAYCFRQAREVLAPLPCPNPDDEEDPPTPEQIQACASSLFIAASRKFNL